VQANVNPQRLSREELERIIGQLRNPWHSAGPMGAAST
jgi:hypothetical protein